MKKDVSLAFLLIKEHPMGRAMIADLLKQGCKPRKRGTKSDTGKHRHYSGIL